MTMPDPPRSSEAENGGESAPAMVVEGLSQFAREAPAMAREAGRIVAAFFGKPVEVEYKDKKNRDPVTAADKASQAYLVQAIGRAFPDHGVLGEENPAEDEDSPASDFLWVLDPLDGTTNFMNGLPCYAVSIALLHKGTPLAGALYIPWPHPAGGLVLHAVQGGGAYADGERISLASSEGPEPNRLTGIPGSFGSQFRLGKALRAKVGEVRVTGSIAYELAMVARGVMQYAIMGAPRLWDVAAGALVVVEAGGAVMLRRRQRWEPMVSLITDWEQHHPTLKELRRWVRPLVAGNTQAAQLVAAQLRRRSPSLAARAHRLLHRRRRQSDQAKAPGGNHGS